MCVEGISIGINSAVKEIADALGLGEISGWTPTERRDALIRELKQLVQRKKSEAYSTAIHETVNTIARVFELDIPHRNDPIERRDILIGELERLVNHRAVIRVAEGDEIFQHLLEAAEQGDADAMFCLGRIHENGECGVRKNHNKAKEW